MESLWLLAVFLVPLAFLDRDSVRSEAVIGYVEVPKVALMRTLVALMTVFWLIEWGTQSRVAFRRFSIGAHSWLRPSAWIAGLANYLRGRPKNWLFLAVGFYLGTTFLSMVLSGSFRISLWGEVPGQDGYSAYTILAYVLLFTVVATHLKTLPQLWRLLGAIVVMGVLVGGYTVLQQLE